MTLEYNAELAQISMASYAAEPALRFVQGGTDTATTLGMARDWEQFIRSTCSGTLPFA